MYAQPDLPTSSHRFSEAQEEEEFESRFASIQDAYESAAAANDAGRYTSLARPDDPRPPKFFDGQRPTVILAPRASETNSSLLKRGKADRYERAHMDGYEGITEEHEENIRRFVDNVRVGAAFFQTLIGMVD
jgi:hypothetical protein